MKIPKLFRSKATKRRKKLLSDYNKGKILQVDNGIDNKEWMKNRENDGYT
jgi:hypothetical protein